MRLYLAAAMILVIIEIVQVALGHYPSTGAARSENQPGPLSWHVWEGLEA